MRVFVFKEKIDNIAATLELEILDIIKADDTFDDTLKKTY